MPILPISAVLAAIALQGAPVPAADFNGVWAMDRARSESAAQEGASREVMETIKQTGADVQVVTTRDGRVRSVSYPIGAAPTDPDALSEERLAYWQGPALVSEGSVDIDGQTVSYRERRTLAADGREMIVETMLKMQHGYTMRGAQTMVSGKDTYIRGR